MSGGHGPSAVGLREDPARLPVPDSRFPVPGSRFPRLFLGIDGGQTGTQAVLADATGRVLGHGAGGPSNHVEMPGGRERLRQAILDSAGAVNIDQATLLVATSFG